jgi:TetR/AcrR family transcriptional regulator, regulator of mycofactocin system
VPTSRAKPSGWDKRRRRVTTQLQLVAVRLFAERGYDNVSIADIAEAAEVSPRTVFRYFATKEDILLAAPRSILALFNNILDEMPKSGYVIDDVINESIARSADYRVPPASLFDDWRRALDSAPGVQSRMLGEQKLQAEEFLMVRCAEALEVAPDDIRARAAAAVIAALQQAVLAAWLEQGGEVELATLYKDAIEGVRHSLRSEPPT